MHIPFSEYQSIDRLFEPWSIDGLRGNINFYRYALNRNDYETTPQEMQLLERLGNLLAHDLGSQDNRLYGAIPLGGGGYLRGRSRRFEMTPPLHLASIITITPLLGPIFVLSTIGDNPRRFMIPYYSRHYPGEIRTSLAPLIAILQQAHDDVVEPISVMEEQRTSPPSPECGISIDPQPVEVIAGENDDGCPDKTVSWQGEDMQISLKELTPKIHYLSIYGRSTGLLPFLRTHRAAIEQVADAAGRPLLFIHAEGWFNAESRSGLAGQSRCPVREILYDHGLATSHSIITYLENDSHGRGCPRRRTDCVLSCALRINYPIPVSHHCSMRLEPDFEHHIAVLDKECREEEWGALARLVCARIKRDDAPLSPAAPDLEDILPRISKETKNNIQACSDILYIDRTSQARSEGLVIVTKPIYVDKLFSKSAYAIQEMVDSPIYHGRFMITIDLRPTRRISIINLDSKMRSLLGAEAAHVCMGGMPCFGSICSSLTELLVDATPAKHYRGLDVAIMLILRYLKTANLSDSWGSRFGRINVARYAQTKRRKDTE